MTAHKALEFGKRIMPEVLKGWVRPLWYRWRALWGEPAPGTDWVGYETLIRFIRERALDRLPGDFIEIGAFLGGARPSWRGWHVERESVYGSLTYSTLPLM